MTAVSESLNILLVEDEGIISEMTKVMLEDMGHNVSAVAHTKRKALEAIESVGYNFAILDINIEGGMEGIELAGHISARNIPFMFLTSYADKRTLSEAKKTLPGAYVLKPFTEEELFTGIEMSLMHAGQVETKTVNIKDGHRSLLIDPDHILYLKADNIYIEVYAEDKKVVSRQTLSAILEKLPKGQFIRVHRSYAVNRKKITAVSKNSLQVGNEFIPISRSYREDVLGVLKAESRQSHTKT